MIRFAEVLSGQCVHIGEAEALPVFAPPLEAVDLTGHPEVQEGWHLINGVWGAPVPPPPPPPPPVPPPPPPPKVYPVLDFTLEAIGPDAAQAIVDGTEATLLFAPGNRIKTTVAVKIMGHVLDGKDGFPSFDHKFRLPIQPVDAWDHPSGPAIQKLLSFTKGVAVAEFEPEQAVAYLITQDSIGSRLSDAEMVKLPSTVRIVAVRP